jgi:hypothetical protein
MIGEIITVNGIDYKAVKAYVHYSCVGCVGDEERLLCMKLGECSSDKTIYKRHYRLKSTETCQTGDKASDNDKSVTL